MKSNEERRRSDGLSPAKKLAYDAKNLVKKAGERYVWPEELLKRAEDTEAIRKKIRKRVAEVHSKNKLGAMEWNFLYGLIANQMKTAKEAFAKKNGVFHGVKEAEFGYLNTGLDEGNVASKSIKTAFGQMIGRTSAGGPKSKYQDNQDSLLMVSGSNAVIFGSFDGAGTEKAKLASAIAAFGVQQRMMAKSGLLNEVSNIDDAVIRYTRKRSGVGTYEDNGGSSTAAFAKMQKIKGKLKVEAVGNGDARFIRLTKGEDGKYRIDKENCTTLQNVAQLIIDSHDPKKRANFSEDEKTVLEEYKQDGDDRATQSEYYNDGRHNTILGAFGYSDTRTAYPEVKTFFAKKGDILLTASDGLWDNVSDFEIKDIANRTKNAEEFFEAVWDLAYERNNSGGEPFDIQHDENTTVTKSIRKGDNMTIQAFVVGG